MLLYSHKAHIEPEKKKNNNNNETKPKYGVTKT